MGIHPNCVCEEVNDGVVVLHKDSQVVLHVTGEKASLVKRLLAGEVVGENEPEVSELIHQGILVTQTPNEVSRRTLILSGTVLGAGGIMAMSLPGVAVASSSSGLPTPIFTNVSGQDYVNTLTVDNDGGAFVVRVLRLEFSSFQNRASYDPTALLEWSFSSEGPFLTFGETATRYQWASLSGIEVPGYPAAGNRYTVFLRVRLGDHLSDSVAVLFAES
jgi:hypothetical protein